MEQKSDSAEMIRTPEQRVAEIVDQVANMMELRKDALSVLVPTDEEAKHLARALRCLGFKATATTGIVGTREKMEAKPIVRVSPRRRPRQ